MPQTKIMVKLSEKITDSQGQLLLPDGTSYGSTFRYNGGWTKTVTGLDKTKDNGYSIMGDFVEKVDSLAYRVPGLYVDCSIGGSRKNTVRHYRLFRLFDDASVTIIQHIKDGRDWAVKLWDAIETALNEIAADDQNIPVAPLLNNSLSDLLARAVATTPESTEPYRTDVFRALPVLSELSFTDLGNIVDVLGHKARQESEPGETRSADITNRIAQIRQELIELDALMGVVND